MSLDESTQAERDFFASRGRNTDALVAENPNLKADRITDETPAREARDTGADTQQREQREGEERGPVHSQERQPSPTVAGTHPESTEARSGPIPDDQDEPGPPGSPHPKRVGWTRYKQLLDERESWQAERQQYTDRMARLDERLKLINEAMTPAEQDPDPQPDPTQDAYAYMQWQDRQREAQQQQFQQYLQQQAARDADQQILTAYQQDAQRFVAQQPWFGPAYQYVQEVRAKNLNRNPWLTPEQRQQIVRDEELNLARECLTNRVSPAEVIFGMALDWGFENRARELQAQWQQQTPSAQASLNQGANGAAGNGSASMPAAPPSTPSAVQQVQNVIAGQAASRSLSQAGGGNAVQNFSARELADMSEDEFNAVFSRLQGTGNKARLRELMGA